MINIHKFVTEDDVNYYKSKTNDEIKEMMDSLKNIDFSFSENEKN